jgi:hypothetical protein
MAVSGKKAVNNEQKSQRIEEIEKKWSKLWPDALKLWSQYINLRKPSFYHTNKEAINHGVKDTFAQISMADLGTHFNLEEILDYGLEDLAMPIMCHEIGHHVLIPGNLADLARLIEIVKTVIANQQKAALLENLYADLIINDRLYRSRHLPMDEVYRKFYQKVNANAKKMLVPVKSENLLWTFYLRIYETLWKLPRGSLIGTSAGISQRMDFDAGIAARIVRALVNQPFRAIKKLAYVFLPYLPSNAEVMQIKAPIFDLESLGDIDLDKIGDYLYGLTRMSEDEIAASKEGELDAYNFGEEEKEPNSDNQDSQGTGGQMRTPAQLGKMYRDLGIKISPHKVALLYYKELAGPHLVPFPTQRYHSSEKVMEGTEVWSVGENMNELSWFDSILESPVIIPGVTTRKKVYGEASGDDFGKDPLWLDLYIDCSGSMPNPQSNLSYLALAGVIMAMSALRVGAKVQVTLWSDYGKFKTTRPKNGGPLSGFLDDEEEVLRMVTGFLNGCTGFPLNILRQTYSNFPEDTPLIHIMSISDSGIDTILNKDEYGTKGSEIIKYSLANAGGGGTQVLNIYSEIDKVPYLVKIQKLGFDMYAIRDWKELLTFAAEFSEKTYGETK